VEEEPKEQPEQKTQHHEAIIEVNGVERQFRVGQKQIGALSGVDLKVYSTDFLVIFGPSGCGKSTLLNIISGLDKPTKGKVEIRDTNIFGMDEDDRGIFRSKKMGIILQLPRWIGSLNVLENIALPLLIEGTEEKIALEHSYKAMKDLKIENLAKQQPNQLSGGEQQKAALARALVTNPWIILADEPTGNLDSTSSDEIMAIFDYLNRNLKRTIILVSHNQAYWNIGTRRVEMRDGKVVSQIENRM
jgi:putative ABC transport system ATP-binding protein